MQEGQFSRKYVDFPVEIGKIFRFWLDNFGRKKYTGRSLTLTNEPEVVLVPELAEEAGVTGENIRQLLQKGLLKGRKHSGTWVISRAEADRYLNSRKGRTRAFFGRKRKGE